MSLRTQSLTAVGVANSTVLDGGITSTAQEKIRVVGFYITSDEQAGNIIEGWISQTRFQQIYDYNIDTIEASGTNQYLSVSKVGYLKVDKELREGETFQVGVNCGGTATDIFGAYEFEVIGE